MGQEYCLLWRLWLMMVIYDKLTVKRKLKEKIILEFEESQMFKTREDRRERELKQKEIQKLRRNQSNSWEYKQKKTDKKFIKPQIPEINKKNSHQNLRIHQSCF